MKEKHIFAAVRVSHAFLPEPHGSRAGWHICDDTQQRRQTHRGYASFPGDWRSGNAAEQLSAFRVLLADSHRITFSLLMVVLG